MRWASPLAVFTALCLFGGSAAALCPGDLNADGVVTVDEILTMANAAVNGCPDTGCPGDLNGDGIVTVDEILQAVNAALNGCPGQPPAASPTATATDTLLPNTATATATDTLPPPTASPTPTPSETATPSTCPYTFLDDTLSLGVSCDYLGPFNADPTCPKDLEALFSSDGTMLGVGIDASPGITFVATVLTATSATLQGYTVGNDTTVIPATGTIQLQQNGSVLMISPDTSPFDLASDTGQCAFAQYTASYIGVLGPEPTPAARKALPRRSVVIRQLQPVVFHVP